MDKRGTSLAVQWLGLRTSTAGGMGSIPGRGTKILYAAWHSQKKKKDKDLKTIHFKRYLSASKHGRESRHHHSLVGGPLSPLVCTSRIKSSLDWPSTVWTRLFTGPTSVSLPLGEPVCTVESQAPSSDKVGKQMSFFLFGFASSSPRGSWERGEGCSVWLLTGYGNLRGAGFSTSNIALSSLLWRVLWGLITKSWTS